MPFIRMAARGKMMVSEIEMIWMTLNSMIAPLGEVTLLEVWVPIVTLVKSKALAFVGLVGAFTKFDQDLLATRIKGQYSGAYRLKGEKEQDCPRCHSSLIGKPILNVVIRPVGSSTKVTSWYHLSCAMELRMIPAVKRRSAGNPNEANRLIVYTHAVDGIYTPLEIENALATRKLTMDSNEKNGLNKIHHPDVLSEKFPAEYMMYYSQGIPVPEVPRSIPKEIKTEETPEIITAPSEQGNVIFSLIEPSLRVWSNQFTGSLKGDMRNEFDDMMQKVEDALATAPLRLSALDNPEVIFSEKTHKKFGRLLRNCRILNDGKRQSSLLVGDAGSGKTFTAEQVLRALVNIPLEAGGLLGSGLTLDDFCMISCNEDTTPGNIHGLTVPNISDGTPTFTRSSMVKQYEKGGIMLFDEFDRLTTGAAVGLNAALAGTKWPLPDGSVAIRSPNTIIIATANTFGHGGNRKYNAANQLDSATIDRFTNGIIEWSYDEDLERSFCPDDELRSMILDARNKMNQANIQRIISPRAMIQSYAHHKIMGIPKEQVFYECLQGWNDNDLKMIGQDPERVHGDYDEPFVLEADVLGGAA